MKKIYILLGLLALIGKLSYGQLSEGGDPFIQDFKLKSAVSEKVIAIDRPNIDSLLNSVEKSETKRDIAAVAVDLDLDVLRGTSWEYQGGKVFELSLRTPDATGLIVHFSGFSLPLGAKVFVYNDKAVLGAFTHQNNKPFGSLTLQELKGNKATVQLFVPKGKESQVKLKVGNVGYGFNKSLSDGDGGPNLFGVSLPCNHEVNSRMGMFHQKEKRSVVLMIHLEYAFYVRYTAVLVNNYKNDGTPYFLTAKHCFEKVFSNREFHAEYAETAVAHFAYESLVPGENGDWTKTISGAELLCYDASEEADYYDLVLLKFSETPPQDFKPYYAGVKTTEPEISNIQYNLSKPQGNATFAAIHHPVGDVKKITWYERVVGISDKNFSVSDSDGLTERGSSGSPLFDKERYVVGVLSGGSNGGSNIDYDCSSIFRDTYTPLIGSSAYLPELQTYLFGETKQTIVEPFESYNKVDELMFYPSSLKIDHDEEILGCINVSSANYSNFRWDFGEGAEPLHIAVFNHQKYSYRSLAIILLF